MTGKHQQDNPKKTARKIKMAIAGILVATAPISLGAYFAIKAIGDEVQETAPQPQQEQSKTPAQILRIPVFKR